MIHHFKVTLAQEFGIEEAIFIDEFRYQISRNKANEKNFHDGRYWTYNSQKAYAELFPYLNIGKIKRIISNLVEKGILLKGNFNANQYDRTNWYAFTDEGLSIVQNCYIHEPKMTNGRVENDSPIPTTIPTTKTTISFTSADEDTDAKLFSEDEEASAIATITMLSSEKNLPYGAQTKRSIEDTAKMFEDLWLMYERKGSKANAKKEFAKLTEEEIAMMRSHIPAYLQSRPERQYRQDFERYIKHKTFNSVVYSKTNVVLFDPEAVNTSATQPAPQEFTKQNETVTISGVLYR